MGRVCTLYELTPKALARVRRSRRWDERYAARHVLVDGLETLTGFVASRRDVLRYCLGEESLVTRTGDYAEERFVDARMVARVSAALTAVDDADAVGTAAGRALFATLREAYRSAAESGHAMLVLIGR